MKYHNRRLLSARIVIPESRGRLVKSGGPGYETSYVKQLKAKQLRNATDELKARQNKIKKNNYIWKLILNYLKTNGPRTRARIARDLNLSTKIIQNVGGYLIRRKLITEKKSKRGDMIYILEVT